MRKYCFAYLSFNGYKLIKLNYLVVRIIENLPQAKTWNTFYFPKNNLIKKTKYIIIINIYKQVRMRGHTFNGAHSVIYFNDPTIYLLLIPQILCLPKFPQIRSHMSIWLNLVFLHRTVFIYFFHYKLMS